MVEISIPVEISTKNPQLKVWKWGQKWHLRSKNAIFWRILGLYVQYLGKGSKWSINTFSNLWIMKIGRVGRFIKNWKLGFFAIFSSFFAHKFSLKNQKFHFSGFLNLKYLLLVRKLYPYGFRTKRRYLRFKNLNKWNF